MVAVRIEPFGGMRPAISDRLLATVEATRVVNANIENGTLRGLGYADPVYTFTGSVIRAVPLYKKDGTRVWFGLGSASASVAQSPVVNDSYDRVYWTYPGMRPQYNTMARIENGDPAYELGITTPSAAPTLTVTGGSGSNETRAYVYTFVTSFGEESAPSPAALSTGPNDATWTVGNLPATYSGINSPVASIRIYRTVSGTQTADYRFVTEVSLGTTSYNDTAATDLVALNSALPSLKWLPPVSTMAGLIRHASGSLVGFDGRNVYFSEPYQPHAWPVSYTYTMPHPVTALASIDDAVIVMTMGRPIILSGGHPSLMAMAVLPQPAPIPQMRGVVVSGRSVFAMSTFGIVQFSASGVQLLTGNLYTPEQWRMFDSSKFMIAVDDTRLVCRVTADKVLTLLPGSETSTLSEVSGLANIDDLVHDPNTGAAYVLSGNQVYEWNSPRAALAPYTWVSKTFVMPKPINLGALQLHFSGVPVTTSPSSLPQWQQDYNASRFATVPLDTLNAYPINGEVTFPTQNPSLMAPLQPLGGVPLFAPATRQCGLSVRVFANSTQVAQLCISDEKIRRLPSGFRATDWQFQIDAAGDITVYALYAAETARELRDV